MPLTIVVPDNELYNSVTGEFIPVKGATLLLEHSLVSISKWESKWEIPYLSDKPKTDEQVIDYIKDMTLTKHVDPKVYDILTNQNFLDIKAYIEKKQTATWFNEQEPYTKKKEVITSELIYYWMIAQNIPKEFEKWPLNRLITLIRVCSIKNAPPKKMGKSAIYNKNRALNEARRRSLGSKG